MHIHWGARNRDRRTCRAMRPMSVVACVGEPRTEEVQFSGILSTSLPLASAPHLQATRHTGLRCGPAATPHDSLASKRGHTHMKACNAVPSRPLCTQYVHPPLILRTPSIRSQTALKERPRKPAATAAGRAEAGLHTKRACPHKATDVYVYATPRADPHETRAHRSCPPRSRATHHAHHVAVLCPPQTVSPLMPIVCWYRLAALALSSVARRLLDG